MNGSYLLQSAHKACVFGMQTVGWHSTTQHILRGPWGCPLDSCVSTSLWTCVLCPWLTEMEESPIHIYFDCYVLPCSGPKSLEEQKLMYSQSLSEVSLAEHEWLAPTLLPTTASPLVLALSSGLSWQLSSHGLWLYARQFSTITVGSPKEDEVQVTRLHSATG